MPRLRYITESEKTPLAKELITSAEAKGAPDPRVVSIMTRNPKAGVAWVKYWNTLLYDGVLPHSLKELCRIQISIAHQCGYCSTVRSNVAISEGLEKKFLYSVKKDFKKIYGKHADAISSFSLDHLLKHNIKKKHIEKLSIKSISIGKYHWRYCSPRRIYICFAFPSRNTI